ncbi:hypothetical protein H5410_030839 [Solanum commersonii]|uniref:Uncharacterized protein n=1 Tax=Solanum commersonii TaxID=4109 RepID=A0A9J5YHD3_SOLCO|nr:hypothetical protein H5410_030839 [Solanum commersonii]
MSKRIQEYGISHQKGIVADSSVRHVARKISVQDGDKEAMINSYLEEVKRSLLLNITQYEKLDTFMRTQPIEATISEDALKKAEDFLRKIKEK